MLRLQCSWNQPCVLQLDTDRSRSAVRATARSVQLDSENDTSSAGSRTLSEHVLRSQLAADNNSRPALGGGIEPDEFERLRSLGIPLKPTFSPPAEDSDAEVLYEEDTQNNQVSSKALPARVTPGLILREKAKAKAQSVNRRSNVLLSEERKRRQFERLVQPSERDMAAAAEKEAPSPKFPFWRRKKDSDGLNDRQLTSRIMELKRRRQPNQILALLEETKARGKKLNTITMNAAVSAFVHCGDVERALDLFEEMSLASPGGCCPDGITYGTLLKGLGNARRLDDAFELLECMEAGTAPGRPELTEVHLNTLVNACADAGDARRARGVLQRFKAYGRGLGPSVLTYNLLIKGYARSENPLEALKVVEEMVLQGLPLERVSYNSLILACIRGGDLDRALDLIQEMKAEAWRKRDASLWPDTVSYTTVLKGFAEDGDLEGVLSVVGEMKAGAQPLEHVRTRDRDQDRFFDDVAQACCLDRVAYGAVIDACLAVGSTQDALAFLHEMESRAQSDPSMRPRAHVFLSLMRALAKAGELAEMRTLRERLGSGEVGGKVWAEDLWEADELVLEAAVISGQVGEAEKLFLGMFARASAGTRTCFSDRGIEAVVRLSAASEVPGQKLEPVALRPEVRPRSVVEVVMLSSSEAVSLPVGCRREELEVALRTGQGVIPVLNEKQECVGVLSEEHLEKWGEMSETDSGLLKASALVPPPSIPRYAPVGDAASLMLSKAVRVLTVVQGDARHEAGLVRQNWMMGKTAVGFVFYHMLF